MAEQENKKSSRTAIFVVIGAVALLLGALVIAALDTAEQKREELQQKQEQLNEEVEGEINKVNERVYQETTVGMSEHQVYEISGKPDRCTESETEGLGTSKLCYWGHVGVTFLDGTVHSKTKI